MESRVILANLLRRFTFELTPENREFLAAHDPDNKLIGVNYGTMGPRDLRQAEMVEVQRGW